MKDESKEKANKEKKALPKESWWGLIPGIAMGGIFGGFISYVISIAIWIYAAKKAIESDEKEWRIIFWIIAAIVFIVGSFLSGIRMNSEFIIK